MKKPEKLVAGIILAIPGYALIAAAIYGLTTQPLTTVKEQGAGIAGLIVAGCLMSGLAATTVCGGSLTEDTQEDTEEEEE